MASTSTASSRTDASTSAKEAEACPLCVTLDPAARKRFNVVWISCEQCSTWYHPPCLKLSPEEVSTIDVWYCSKCQQGSADSSRPLVTTIKTAARKSDRPRQLIDYRNMNAHLPSDPGRFMKILASKAVEEGYFKTYQAADLTDEWIYGAGMDEPFVVKSPEGLGMTMPSRDITVTQIAKLVGGDKVIEVIDVASQAGLSNWTLNQWATYYDSADGQRGKIRNVISLELSATAMRDMVVEPAIVKKLDFIQHWPEALRGKGLYPQVQKYCLMSVAHAYTDFHIDFFGSSVFYHVLRGSKTFYFIRPTAANLAHYESWSSSSDTQQSVWLGDLCDAVHKITLVAGNTMLIPSGWIHSVYTPEDSLVFGGNFLSSLDMITQFKVYDIELATKVPRKFRFPESVRLHWYVADAYARQLRHLSRHPTARVPVQLSPKVMRGLKALSAFLIDQVSRFAKNAPVSTERRRVSKENVPVEIKDPASLARELRSLVLRALGEKADALCSPPPPNPVPTTVKVQATASVQQSEITTKPGGSQKRKAEQLAGPIKKAAPRPTDDGEILQRVVVPVVKTSTMQNRVDPKDKTGEAKAATVATSSTSTSVVRRSLADGQVVLETRTVTTVVERVVFMAPSSTEASKHNLVETPRPKKAVQKLSLPVPPLQQPTPLTTSPLTAASAPAQPSSLSKLLHALPIPFDQPGAGLEPFPSPVSNHDSLEDPLARV